jgi:hypothetical protein
VHHANKANTCESRSTYLRSSAILLAFAFLAVLFIGPQAAHAAVTQPAFPRLAVWWPNNDTQSATDRARCDWIALQSHDANHIAELRAANPNLVVLGSTSARELNYRLGNYDDPFNVELRGVSTDWMLTQIGSSLTSAVDAATTSIPVADVTKFAVGEMALVDHELMHIDAINGSVLTVTARGPVNPPAAHAAGTRIASLVSNWAGSVTMDMSTNCPKRDVGHGLETWNDWNARRGATIVASADWDGLLIDCLEGNPSWMATGGNNRSIDPLRTNVAVTDGYAAFNSAWNTGAVAYGNELRAAVGTHLLIGNGNMRNFNMNGNIFETFPYAGVSLATWKIVFVGPYDAPRASYPEWCAGAVNQNLTMVQTYGAPTDYQLLRFGLTSALMNNGYFSYALSDAIHAAGGLYWFDEYDNAGAGRGYLGQPTGPAVAVGNAYRRDYTGGVALVNPSDAAVTVQLGGTFQKIKGTQAPTVNDGSLVTAVTIPAKDGVILLKIAAPAPVPAPSGTLTVAGGATQVTSPVVTVASAVTGATDMRIDSGSGTFGSFAPYAASVQITLAGAPGIKTVRVEYRNASGTIQLTDTVELVAPVIVPTGSFTLASGASTVNTVIVPVSSSATNASEMRFLVGSGSWSAWTAYAAASQVTLPATDGDYVVSAQYASTSGGVLAQFALHPSDSAGSGPDRDAERRQLDADLWSDDHPADGRGSRLRGRGPHREDDHRGTAVGGGRDYNDRRRRCRSVRGDPPGEH